MPKHTQGTEKFESDPDSVRMGLAVLQKTAVAGVATDWRNTNQPGDCAGSHDTLLYNRSESSRRQAISPAPRAPAPLPLAPLRAHARRPRRAPSSARRCRRRRWHTVARPTFSIQTSIGANFQHSNFQIPRKLPERHVSVARRCRYVVVKLVAERNLHVVFQKAHAAGG